MIKYTQPCAFVLFETLTQLQQIYSPTKLFTMAHTRCNYCGQVVQFIDIRGNNTCPICRQSSTSCCEGGSCTISYTDSKPSEENTTNKHALHEIERVNENG